MFPVGQERTNSRELVELAYSDPELAIVRASAVLDRSDTTILDRCHALWAVGLARRELGDTELAAEHLEHGRVAALAAGEPTTAGRIATTLALTRSQLGESSRALGLLDDAEPELTGTDRGHLLLQRGLVLMFDERIDEALAPTLAGLAIFEAADDRLSVARAHLNLGVIYGSLHRHNEAMHHAQRATEIAGELGRGFLSAQARHNVGYAAYRLGDVPRALREMAAAEEQLRSLEAAPLVIATILQDRASVELEANLVEEACADAEHALAAAGAGTNTVLIAEVTLLSSQCLLRTGRLELARERAIRAGALLAEVGRTSWEPLSRLVALQAARRAGRPIDVDVAERVARELAGRRWRNDAAAAALLAADAVDRSGDRGRAIDILDRCRRQPRGSTALERSGSAVVRAHFHALRGDDRSARAAVTAGFRSLTENRAAVGAIELRAHAIEHGQGLAQLGMSLAMRAGRPREFLARAELGRGVVTALGRVRPYDDRALSELMVKYRTLTRRIHDEIDSGRSPGRLLADRVAAEAELRTTARRSAPAGEAVAVDVGEAVRGLRRLTMLEFVELEDELVAVVVESGRSRLVALGRPDVRPLVDQLSLGLNRLNRARLSAGSRDAALAAVADVGGRLADVLIPRDLRVGDGGLVIVPSGDLHALPWALLPPLRHHPIRVAPSLLTWYRASCAPRRATSVGFIAGPGLEHADREIAALGALVGESESLGSDRSRVDACAALLGRVDIAHLACHGTYRADNPMFSSLRLADGDLTVYDLERLTRLPRTVILSACEVGQSDVLPGQALLGLASALIQLGVSSVIAPLTPVNDARSVEVMVRLHTQLAAGVAPPEALAAASELPDGPLDPTAMPYVCFGS